jgi:hypothetical protein
VTTYCILCRAPIPEKRQRRRARTCSRECQREYRRQYLQEPAQRVCKALWSHRAAKAAQRGREQCSRGMRGGGVNWWATASKRMQL